MFTRYTQTNSVKSRQVLKAKHLPYYFAIQIQLKQQKIITNIYFEISFIQKTYKNNGCFSNLGIFWELIMSFTRVFSKFNKNMCPKEFDTIKPYFFS